MGHQSVTAEIENGVATGQTMSTVMTTQVRLIFQIQTWFQIWV